MELIFRPQKKHPLILKAISQYANSPEHNYALYDSFSGQWEKVYCHFLDGSGILALRRDKHWKILGLPLARVEERISVLFALIEHLFVRKEADRITLQIKERHMLLDLEKHTDIFRTGQITQTIHHPAFSFDSWETNHESIRKIQHALEKLAPKEAKRSKTELKKLVLESRKGKDEYSHLFNLIEGDFQGIDTRILEKDGRPASLMGWWNVAGCMFVGIEVVHGIELEAALLELLLHLKKIGSNVILNSRTPHDLDIKNKLHPTEIFETYEFSVFNL